MKDNCSLIFSLFILIFIIFDTKVFKLHQHRKIHRIDLQLN